MGRLRFLIGRYVLRLILHTFFTRDDKFYGRCRNRQSRNRVKFRTYAYASYLMIVQPLIVKKFYDFLMIHTVYISLIFLSPSFFCPNKDYRDD